MTLQEAFAIRDRLGWTPAPDDGTFFTTRLSTNGQEDGHIGIVNEGGVNGVSLPLSSRALPPQWAQAAPITRAAYPQYVQASTALWGPSHDKRGRNGSRINRWSGHDSGRGGEGAQQPGERPETAVRIPRCVPPPPRDRSTVREHRPARVLRGGGKVQLATARQTLGESHGLETGLAEHPVGQPRPGHPASVAPSAQSRRSRTRLLHVHADRTGRSHDGDQRARMAR